MEYTKKDGKFYEVRANQEVQESELVRRLEMLTLKVANFEEEIKALTKLLK